MQRRSTPTLRNHSWPVLALASCIVISGCGGEIDDEGGATSRESLSALPAFPGAAGGGAATVGGRGGQVIEITTTQDGGPGSFRACVNASGPRTCVFRVAGLFPITEGDIRITSPFLTVAGQTAPGEVLLGGPHTSGALFGISTHDVVVRYVTMSPDNASIASGPDTGTTSVWIVNCGGGSTLGSGGCYNIMVDHVTTRWSGNKSWITTSNFTPFQNGNGDGDGPNHAITTQWTLDYEPHEGHPVGFGTATDESCVGTLAGPCLSPYETDIDFHHDVFVNVDHRIPENSNRSSRWVNNIIYNWSYYANEWLGAESIDDINNKFIKGNLNANAQAYPIHFTTNSPEMSGAPSAYVAGNIYGSAGDNTINSDQYGQLVREITGENGDETGPIPDSWKRSSPLPADNGFPIVPDPAPSLDTILLATVGNSQHLDCAGSWVSHRDPEDTRVIDQYKSAGSGGFWPNGVTATGQSSIPTPTTHWQDHPVTGFTACAESQHDGIPDAWKTAHGLSTSDADLYKEIAPNGYTYLENYLDSGATASTPPPTSPPAPPTGLSATFTMVDTDTHQPVAGDDPITNGAQISLASAGPHLSIQALPSMKVGSVVFELDSDYTHTENAAPYSLCGDDGASYGQTACSNLGVGSHTLSMKGYAGTNGAGAMLGTVTLAFSIVAAGMNGPSPPPPVSSGGLTISDVIAMPSANGAVVSWQTNVLADSQVGYGLSAAALAWSPCCAPASTMSHEVTLTGLQPSTTYHFIVESEGGGVLLDSLDATFTTR